MYTSKYFLFLKFYTFRTLFTLDIKQTFDKIDLNMHRIKKMHKNIFFTKIINTPEKLVKFKNYFY